MKHRLSNGIQYSYEEVARLNDLQKYHSDCVCVHVCLTPASGRVASVPSGLCGHCIHIHAHTHNVKVIKINIFFKVCMVYSQGS